MTRTHLKHICAMTTVIALAWSGRSSAGELTTRPLGRAQDRPNVLLVMTDDQGYGDLGCHGNPILKTPHIDRLHGEAVRLTDFHVSPLCTPTRGALMTGRDPGRNGAYRTSAGRSMYRKRSSTGTWNQL